MFYLFAFLLSTALSLVAAGTNEAGLAFLAENRKKPGVIELPSGLQYKVLKKGRGPAYPTVDSPCSCHYEGKLIDGTVFDSSYDRGSPSTFAPNQVIKGWTEAMQMMVVGDKVRNWSRDAGYKYYCYSVNKTVRKFASIRLILHCS